MVDPFELYVTDFVSEMNKQFRPRLEKLENNASLLVLDSIVNFVNDDKTADYVEQRRKLSIREFLERLDSSTLGEIGINLSLIGATESYNIIDLINKLTEYIYNLLYV